MALTQEELARAVAAEMGPEVAAEAEAELSREKTRSMGQFIVDAATIGAFIAQATQLAIQLHATQKSPAGLIAALQARTASAIAIAGDMRHTLIERIAGRLTGSN